MNCWWNQLDYGESWVQIPSGARIFPTSQWVFSAIHFICIGNLAKQIVPDSLKSAQRERKMCKTLIQDQRQQLPFWETLVGFYADCCQRTRLPAGMRFQDVLQLPAFDTSKATASWDSDLDTGFLFAPQTHKVAGPTDHSLMKEILGNYGTKIQ